MPQLLLRNGAAAQPERGGDVPRRGIRPANFGFLRLQRPRGLRHSLLHPHHHPSVRILRSTNNLDKLEKLNSLSRRVCLTKLPLDEAEQELLAILAAPDYPWPISYLGHGCAALFFSLLFGGTLADACVAFLSGLLVKRTVTGLTKRGVNAFFINLVASLFMVAVPVLLRFAGLPVQPDKVIIGAIMLLVPGVAITNVMRDVIAGDFLTAISKLAEVLIVALAIAIGIALAYVLTGALLGGAA